LVVLCLFVYSSRARAQEVKDDQPLRVETYLVNVPVIATDRQGRFYSGLKKENFSLVQDGEVQEIAFFADEKAPMNVVILIDSSFSTKPFLADIKSAARDFIKVFRPEDQGMIVSFESNMKVIEEFTSDQKKLRNGIDKVSIGGGSNMNDALYMIVTNYLSKIEGRKAVIVLTDGMVNGIFINNQKLLNTLAESDILVYPILYKTKDNWSTDIPKVVKRPDGTTMSRDDLLKTLERARDQRLEFMVSLATYSGGRLIENKAKNFKDSFQQIADELRNQYLIGFYPQNVGAGTKQNFAVELNIPDLTIRTKKSIKLKPVAF